MKNYPAKSKKRNPKSEEVARFDKSKLTTSDSELLKAFEERREKFERLMEESSIIYDKKTCPGCGFPTFEDDDEYYYMTCIICLWEGYSSGKNDTYQGPPNYISLVEHRINVSNHLQLFLKTNDIDDSIDTIIKTIRRFEQGSIDIDRDNFEKNLKNILPTKPYVIL